MFARANAARRRGDHVGAIVLYRDLLRDHPDAAEASAARVTLGRLLLDDGDAEGALRSFDAYLRGGDGALREEAMVGRARVLGRLGRDGEERGAWSALLQSYPQSIHAERARARLEQLGHR
jgi:TolA-binding protein